MGLFGRVAAILLLTIVLEFAVSALLYERASEFSVRDDEARRLAEHLVISRRLMEERAPAARGAMARDLTTDRYAIGWNPGLPPPPRPKVEAETMRAQVTAWEPSLDRQDLRLRFVSPGRGGIVAGGLTLADGSWLRFRTLQPVTSAAQVYRRILLALIPAIALMVIGGMLLRRTLLPLRQLADAADRVGGRSDPPTPVAEDGPGEVRRVIAAFNRMQARIQRLIADRTQALAAVGHDLRTPLARLRLRAETIDASDLRATIAADVDEMDAMVASLLAFLGGDSDPEPPVRIDLAVLCATLVDDATDRGHDAEYAGPDHFERVVRAGAIKRALANLVDNAIHHATWLRVSLHSGAEGVAIVVEDNGPGIPVDQLAAVIEPFVRLDAARRRDTVGFGLGLAIVTQAAAAEGGALRLANREYGGLRAEISLPPTGP